MKKPHKLFLPKPVFPFGATTSGVYWKERNKNDYEEAQVALGKLIRKDN